MTTVDPSLLRQAAAAAGHQRRLPGTLYVVATPIGNLADLTLRAVHVLATVDAVACEDTRVGGTLLRHLGLHPPLLALHAHNERTATAGVLARLAAGESVAYVSDAGTPAVSDPGAVLVAGVRAAGHRVVPVPGPSAALAALSAAGDAVGAEFRFCGFLPPRGAQRQRRVDEIAARPETQVLFEAPHRVAALAAALAVACPARPVTLARELTKQFEEIATVDAASLPAWLAQSPQRDRGEFVLVLHALPAAVDDEEASPVSALHALDLLLAQLPLKQAVSLAARLTGQPRNRLYALALQRRGDAQPQRDRNEDEDEGDEEREQATEEDRTRNAPLLPVGPPARGED